MNLNNIKFMDDLDYEITFLKGLNKEITLN